DVESVAALVDDAGQHEKRAGGDAVVQHLVDRAVHAQLGEAEDAEHYEAQVADGRVGDQLFQVGLHHGDKRAIDDADNGQHHDPGLVLTGLIGEEPEVEAEEAVGAHFQQHTRQHDGARGGRFKVCVRQPGVQGEDGYFYRERDKESQKQPAEGVAGDAEAGTVADRVLNGDVVEAAGLGVEKDDGGQHEGGGDHGEEEELHRRVNAPLVAIHADDERHRDEGEFPEEVEEKQVEGNEYAEQRGFQNEQEDEEFLHP